MNYYYLSAIVFLFISNALTLNLLLKEKKINKKRPESYELTEFMRDLLNRDGLLKVSRVNPENLFLRSPRGE